MPRRGRFDNFMTVTAILITSALFTPIANAFPGGNPNKQKTPPVFQVRYGKVVLDENLATPMPNQAGVLNQKVKISESITATLMDYFPRATEVKTFVPVKEGGFAAITLELSSGKEKLSRDLIADGSSESTLETVLGPLTVKSYPDAKAMEAGFQKLSMSALRAPTLVITHDDGKTFSILATKGTKSELKETGYTVEILDFRPSFVMSNATNKVDNATGAMTNPAVKYRIFSKDKTQTMWSFARYPDFKMSKEKNVPFSGTLDCPVSQEKGKMLCSFVLVGETLEAWMKKEGKATRHALAVGKKLALTDTVSAQVTKIQTSVTVKSEIKESPRAVDKPALKVVLDYTGKKKPSTTHWLRANVPVDVDTAAGVLKLRLGVQASMGGGMGGGMGGMGGGMGGMGGGMPKGHPPTGGTGGGMPKGHPPTGGTGGGMPKGHPPTGGTGGGMPKGHPPTGGTGGGMPKGHPPIEKTPDK